MESSVKIAINFISWKYDEEKCLTHSSSGNIIFTPYTNANDPIDKLFNSLYSRYQENSQTSMKGSYSFFDSVQLLYFKCHKVIFTGGGSYIDSQDCKKKKKATITPKKCR